MFLLFDFVHLIKSIRNNWLTGKTGELNFKDDMIEYTAKWKDVQRLYELEKASLGENTGVVVPHG